MNILAVNMKPLDTDLSYCSWRVSVWTSDICFYWIG